MFRGLIAVAAVALATGCQTKPSNTIYVGMNADGAYNLASSGGTNEDKAIAALLQAAMNGELDFGAEDEQEPLSEEEVWRQDAAGNLTHIQSGAQCPARWGEYARGRSSIFRPDGMDVGCNYEGPDGKIMTFYVYQNTETLREELETTFETMKTRQPVSTEAPFGATPASGSYAARTLAYEMADGTRMRTSVLLTTGGSWRMKIRLTCKADDAVRTETAAGLALMGQADRLNTIQRPTPAPSPAPI